MASIQFREVIITGGMKEFHGQRGYVREREGKYFRIRLDCPVEIPGVGLVRDDLWERSGFKLVRER